jgi:hypothetical protein
MNGSVWDLAGLTAWGEKGAKQMDGPLRSHEVTLLRFYIRARGCSAGGRARGIGG